MPSDDTTGRCYCGAARLSASQAPLTVAYCHCTDCRRWTGGPVAAFAAFAPAALRFTLPLDDGLSAVPGVRRWHCRACGSPLAATFDYLPDQVYVPLGLLDNAADLPPQLHCHSEAALPWLHQCDDLPRAEASGRAALNKGTP